MQGWLSSFMTRALLIWAAIDAASATKPSSGCGKTPTLAGSPSTLHSMTVNNKQRGYYVNTPANYDKNHPYRLFLTLHALNGNAKMVVDGTSGYYAWYGLPSVINDTTNAIYVAPDGLNRGWANQGGEDVTFLKQVISTVEADLCIDQGLRFSTGWSFGGAMSYSLTCSIGKEMRGIAVLSGSPQISGCAGSNTDPVAIYVEHGMSDNVLPIAGARQIRDKYLKINGCTAQTAQEPAVGSGKHIRTNYACKDGYPVTYIAFDGPHTPTPTDRGQSRSFAPGETWEWMKDLKSSMSAESILT